MVRLELSKDECGTLRGILEREESDLHRELADTDNWKFKESLKARETMLKKILADLIRAQEGAS
jgi:hypothetical protein